VHALQAAPRRQLEHILQQATRAKCFGFKFKAARHMNSVYACDRHASGRWATELSLPDTARLIFKSILQHPAARNTAGIHTHVLLVCMSS
jgi:hypothetical protein